MNISEVNQNNFSKVITLIKASELPTDDITEVTKLFVATEGNNVIGTVGIERYGDIGLLRSLSVNTESRSRGIGKSLVAFIEDYARNSRLRELFLLTTTAENFFSKLSYEQIKRENAPIAIKVSTEFTSSCPSSAIVMKKVL